MRLLPAMAVAASLAVLAIGITTTLHLHRSYEAGPAQLNLPATSVQAPSRGEGTARLPAPSPAPHAPLGVQPDPSVSAPQAPSQTTQAPLTARHGPSASAPQLLSPPSPAPRAPLSAVEVGPARREGAVMKRAAPGAVQFYSSGAAIGESTPREPHVDTGRDRFPQTALNPVKSVASDPVSTFSIDVDTASYAFVRKALNAGRLPQKEAVRVEELINYFPYSYSLPENRNTPFRSTVTVLPAPWNPANKLVHIAIKGYDIVKSERPRANLVFLIDTSGSMAPEDRLPLLKNAFRMLVDTLRSDDTIGVVTYAGGTQVALEPTKVAEKRKIIEAIDRLNAAGSTAGAAGIQQAYGMAEAAFDKNAVNRVILATDGDFNVGIRQVNELKGFIERKRKTGIFLSVLGVGRGNYNDVLMQALAQNGNGVAAYIDTLNEARKVLVEEASSALFPIAKDVKIQLEFNPARVAEYRLIGYETRILRREDFNNDKVDAGDIGSGHAVTAIYEITPVGSPTVVDNLRYERAATKSAVAPANRKDEYAFLKIRYKLPQEDTSKLIELPITDALAAATIEQASAEVRFSTAVAAFGQLLRTEPYLKNFGYDEVTALATGAKGEDRFGYRAEFVNLVQLAKSARP